MTRKTQRQTAGILASLACVVLLPCCSRSSAPVARCLADLKDAHWQVRASAADALGGSNDDRAIAPLRAVLADDSAEVRTAALTALGRLGARAALDDIRARVADDKDQQVLVQGLFALAAVAGQGQSPAQGDIDLIVEKLFDDHDRVESAARRALFALVGRSELVDRIRADLRSRSVAARVRASRLASVLELRELQGWQNEMLGDAHPEVRSNAFEAILRDPKPDDYAVLLRGLADTSPIVRIESSVGLEDLADPSSLPALTRTAGGDPDADVREAAASGIATILKIPGSQLPAVWHYDRIDDRVVVDREGVCTLTRTLTVAIESSPEGIRELRILLPRAFPQADRVLDAQGKALTFSHQWANGLREIVFSVAPIESGGGATFTVVARSRRLVSADGAAAILLTYSPAPVQARVAALHVGIASPAGEATALDRSGLAPADVEDLVVRAAVPSAGLKLPRPPGRSYSRAADWTAILGVFAALLGALAATIIRLRKTLGERAHRAILVAVLTTGAVLFLTPILTEDNLPYYALARSAVLDGDFDRVNEYTEFNQTQAFAQDNRDPQDPVFASLARTPFVAAAHLLTSVRNGFSPAHAPNGFSFPYLFLTAVGDFLAVLIGCLACFSLVERRVGGRFALFSVLAMVFGTNLVLFAYAWTGSSFQPSFLLFSVFLNHWDKTREGRTPTDWLAAGLLLGLAGMTRTLNLGFVLIPLLDWSRTAATGFGAAGMRGLRKHVGDGVLFASGMLLGLAPQLVVQRLLDHTWIVDAYGVGTGRFAGLRDNAWGLFFSPTNGLLSPMPILALAFIGLVPLFRLDRWLATLLTAALVLQLYAIGSYELFWGYFVYGTPYLVPCTPIFCIALAVLYREVTTRWRVNGAAVLWGLAIVFAARNGWCMLRQIADKMIGEWQEQLGIVQVVHTMLMLDRKLDVDVLRYSSEFGCLVREIVGGVRAVSIGPIVAALGWISLLLLPVFLAYALAGRIRGWVARVPQHLRKRLAVSALAVVWLAVMGWVASVASHTNLDYGYQVKQRFERKREFLIERLKPGTSFTVQLDSANPSERFSVITFLDDAVDVPQGERVAAVELTAGETTSRFDLAAGVDTADFAVDRPESETTKKHRSPLDRAVFSWRVDDDSGRFYTARAYRSVFTAPAASRTTTLKVTSTLAHGTVAVVLATSREPKLPPDPSRRRWLADRR
jgi:HEAT repeat protein